MASAIAAAALTDRAQAQSDLRFAVPKQALELDFTSANDARREQFREDGLCYQLPLAFTLLKHDRVTIVGQFPEPGHFVVELLNPKAVVEVQNVEVQGKQGSAAIVARLELLTFKSAKDRAQQAISNEFERIKASTTKAEFEEKLAQALRPRIEAIVKQYPRWTTSKERESWETADGTELLAPYERLLTGQIVATHLTELGLPTDFNVPGYLELLENKLEAVQLIRSGAIAEKNPKTGAPDEFVARTLRQLTPAEQAAVREALTVSLQCRFYPQIDAQDPNSQWFLGQRVTCLARGIAKVRVEGQLDPEKNDLVDWWILDGYIPQKVNVELPKSTHFKIDAPYVDEKGARLRVVAKGRKAVKYHFELTPLPGVQGVTVTVHESPALVGARFPY
jgi:hypothetical protein